MAISGTDWLEVPSGEHTNSNGIDGPVEIVDFPIYSMVDLSMAKCKRSPEGIIFLGLFLRAEFQGIYCQKMAKNMVQYLHFRILEFPLKT